MSRPAPLLRKKLGIARLSNVTVSNRFSTVTRKQLIMIDDVFSQSPFATAIIKLPSEKSIHNAIYSATVKISPKLTFPVTNIGKCNEVSREAKTFCCRRKYLWMRVASRLILCQQTILVNCIGWNEKSANKASRSYD